MGIPKPYRVSLTHTEAQMRTQSENFPISRVFCHSLAVPDWDRLWEIAAAQEGCFHVRDAFELGFSDKTLSSSKSVERVEGFRGVHRFKRASVGRWHLYTVAFIWSREEGVISHGSALDVWGLSDWMPHHAEMTLPLSWKRRKVPAKILAFYDDLPDEDVQWFEGFRVTTARRSVDDFIAWGVRPDIARQAVEEATKRGRPGGALFHRHKLKHIHRLAR
jgi:predicted transcriptional regulator of viral defense system